MTTLNRDVLSRIPSPPPYNQGVRAPLAIWLLVGLIGSPAAAQLEPRTEPPPQSPQMRDEDEDVLPQTEYAFNPIQAQKDLKIGNFYWKKGNHRAAAARYLEATRWDPSFGEAYWKLAEAREKLNQPAEALDAYRKYLSVETDAKKKDEAQQRITGLEKAMEKLPLAASESDR
jgi:tetratricopeptide (TPR) repeat protein